MEQQSFADEVEGPQAPVQAGGWLSGKQLGKKGPIGLGDTTLNVSQ